MPSTKKLLQAAAGSAGGDPLYAEDVFSTYLYEGTGATQSIDNGIDLDGEGGMTWIKCRNTAFNNVIFDTERGAPNALLTNTTDQNISFYSDSLTSFNSDGFSLGADTTSLLVNNGSNRDYCSWSFRKAEKFFDVVTYTGNSTAGRTVAHNLGSVPACIIIKRTDGVSEWPVYHKDESSYGTTGQYEGRLNETSNFGYDYISGTPTDSVFAVTGDTAVNASGGTYVAYLFASDAGGFGDDGDENIIKCGSYVGDGGAGTTEVNLGFEPQWILVKASSAADNWFVIDNMRGWATESNTSNDAYLMPNNNNAESTGGFLDITSTGFKTTLYSNVNVSGRTYIYIAIRRPMKTPESGTEVFALENGNGGGSSTVPEFAAPFASDLFYMQNRNGGGLNYNGSRLAGNSYLQFNSTAAEASGLLRWDSMNGMYFFSTNDYTGYMFKRATGFMDVVAYTGNGTAGTAQAHNLGVVPEMIIGKNRSNSYNWAVYHTGAPYQYSFGLKLNSSGSGASNTGDFGGASGVAKRPDASFIYIGGNINTTNNTYIAYLFASVAGVSKVGSYTGTGSDLNVDCGFTAGARFILIKRTDSTGDWYVWDSVRGITAGNDPYLLLNSTAAEVTNTDYIDPLSSGFTVTSSAPAALNASGGNYIFLAIA